MPTIKLYANLRTTAGMKELSITGATLGGVLNALIKQVPTLDGIILENGQIRPHFVININGHTAPDLGIPINEQDTIAIFPPIAGG